MLHLKKILVPLDLTAYAERALPYAVELGRVLGGTILTAHFVPAGLSAAGQEGLRAIRERLRPTGADTVVEAADPVPGIVALARREHVDLIVMATHSRGPLSRTVLGSTTEAVVRQAPCPVLVTRHPIHDRNGPFVIRRILCPTDFSLISREAVNLAGALAQAFGAVLDLLHVCTDRSYDSSSDAAQGESVDSEEAEIRDLHDRLEEMGRRLAGVRRGVAVTFGEPVAAILSAAMAHRADLVVMATHGRAGLARLMMGSTTEGVLREAVCPVLTLRGATALEMGPEAEKEFPVEV